MNILKKLYHSPNSTASEEELSKRLKCPQRGLALQIGYLGKKIAKHLGKNPGNYITRGVERPAWFKIVGPYYSHEGKGRSNRPGWEINENLMKALENLELV